MNVTKEEILAIVENVGVSVDISTIKVDVPFKQAGIDSLEMMNVFLGIEEKFGIQIPDEDIADLNTIENIVSYLQKI
jgi:acyl carrier protein